MKNLLLLVSFLIFIFSSCEKEPEEVPAPIHTSQPEVIHYPAGVPLYEFKPGTYWVYKNDSTAVLDSVVVDSVFTGVLNMSIPHATTLEYAYYIMYVHDFGNARYYTETIFNNYIYRKFMGIGSGKPLYSPTAAPGTSWAGGELIAKIPSLTLNTNTFYNIGQMQFDANDSLYHPEFAHNSVYYYSDTIGLIKKVYFLPHDNVDSWSLKRWNIVR